MLRPGLSSLGPACFENMSMASKFQVTNNLSPKEKKEVGRWQIVSWEFESDIISKQARTAQGVLWNRHLLYFINGETVDNFPRIKRCRKLEVNGLANEI